MKNNRTVTTIREITNEECYWIPRDIIPEGTTLYLSSSFSYGCCSKTGVMVSFYADPMKENKNPMEPNCFELPLNALDITFEQHVIAEVEQGNIVYRKMIDEVNSAINN